MKMIDGKPEYKGAADVIMKVVRYAPLDSNWLLAPKKQMFLSLPG